MNRTFAAASAFLFVFLICSVSACDAADHPGHDDALAQIKPHILGSKYGTISNLRYVNGYPKGAVYIVAASWTITFPKSYEEAARHFLPLVMQVFTLRALSTVSLPLAKA
jgi:hypothetical protein